MEPFIVFVVAVIAFWIAGRAGAVIFQPLSGILRVAMSLMFFLTASGHWGKRRPDLIRMVPLSFPRPDLLVTITGVLEILGAIGLLIPSTARIAGICLAILLVVIFPANIRAARENLTIAGKHVPNMIVRTAVQIVFIAALLSVAYLK